MKSALILIIALIFVCPVQAKRVHYEKTYQKYFCNSIGGGIEYYLLDRSGKVDCITDKYAVEVDFANKWAESVGQSLYYALKTNKKPGILIILENKNDIRHLSKIELLAEKYSIKIWTITPQDLKSQKTFEED